MISAVTALAPRLVAGGFSVDEPSEPAYRRTPVSAVRLAGALVVLGLAVLVLRSAGERDFGGALAEVLARAPRWLVSAVVGACQISAVAPAGLGLLWLVATRRFTRLGRMLVAAVLCGAGLLFLARFVGTTTFPLVPPMEGLTRGGTLTRESGYGLGAAFPTSLDLGVVAAWIFVDRGHWDDRWRHIGTVVLLLAVVARFGVGLADPATVVTTLALAAASSSAVQLVLGAPNVRARGAAVGQVLARLGCRVVAVERFAGFAGDDGFRVALEGGRELFVKVRSRDRWAALFPVRAYRAARYRDLGEGGPFRSLRTTVEHEALCALKARSDGVPTPRLVALADVPPRSMLLAFDTRPGRPLREAVPGESSPAVLEQVWRVVAALQRSRTVHRRLNADALLVDDDGTVTVVGFGSAAVGVVGPQLATDVAEVLAATASVIGVERAVSAAVAGVGPEAVAAALPRLQPLALTPATRTAVRDAGSIEALRQEVQRVTGTDAVPLAELERVKPRTIVGLVMAGVAVWTVLPRLVGISALVGELRHAAWQWAAAALVASAASYVAAAISLGGSVPDRLPFWPNLQLQLATSFVTVVAPGGGPLAVTGRFLQKRGVDTATAVAAVGVNSLGGLASHATLTLLFFSLAGFSGLRSFALPSPTAAAAVAAAAAVLLGAGLAVPWSRTILSTRLLPATRRSWASVREVTQQPAKVVEVMGGSLAVTLGYILAMQASVAAFGAGPAFTSVALVYLVGSAVSSAAPTPGGIGPMEAALLAGLTSAGMPGPTALGAVILYRVATFWITLPPAWVAFVALQRSGGL